MDGKASIQESVGVELPFCLFVFVPQIRRKETMMVVQEEEIDGSPEKKKPSS